MPATYPNATKDFGDRVFDLSDTVFAAHVLDIRDEVSAVENVLGPTPHKTAGGTQYSHVAARLAAIDTAITGRASTSHTHAYAAIGHDHDTRYLQLTGGTLTGPLTLAGDPTLALHPASKQWVENIVAPGIFAAPSVYLSGTPTGGTYVDADVALHTYVQLVVPAFTGPTRQLLTGIGLVGINTGGIDFTGGLTLSASPTALARAFSTQISFPGIFSGGSESLALPTIALDVATGTSQTYTMSIWKSTVPVTTTTATIATTVAGASQTFPRTTLNVVATGQFPSTGKMLVTTLANGDQLITYTITDADTFNTNGGGGIGTPANSAAVVFSLVLPSAVIPIASIAGLPSSGQVKVTSTAGPQIVTYTGLTASPNPRLTGCTGGTGTVANGATVSLENVRVLAAPDAAFTFLQATVFPKVGV